MTADENALDRIAERVERLYSLPAVTVEVLRLTSSPKVDVAALKACVENDPALTTKILRVVNSSIFGLSNRVSDLGQALALLGTKPLKMLVLGFSLPSGITSKGRARGAMGHVLNRYWRTTLIKAVAARRLAQTAFGKDGDEAFLIALLQDLGMLILLEQLGETYAEFASQVWKTGGNLKQLEQESLGFEHRQLSTRLLTVWGLPDNLIRPLANSAAAPGSDEAAYQQIAQLADLFARLLIDGRPEQLAELRRMSRAVDVFKAERLDAFVDGLQDQVADLAKVLSLDTPEEPDYGEIIARAHRQLADVASDAVVDMLDGGPATGQVEGLLAQVQDLSRVVADYAKGRAVPEEQALPSATPASDAFETDDPGLIGRVQAAAKSCRRARTPLSLMIVEITSSESGVPVGMDSGGVSALRLACERLDHEGCHVLATRDCGFSLVLSDCDRRQAKDVFRHLEADFDSRDAGDEAICAGVATVSLVPKSFAANGLIDAAVRCLRAAGSGHLKTIEIY